VQKWRGRKIDPDIADGGGFVFNPGHDASP
jgi:hypothetical protein